MPRKSDTKSNNNKPMNDKQRMINDSKNDIAEAYKGSMINTALTYAPTLSHMANPLENYSDFTSGMNQFTDGWYSTIANGLPFVRDLHNSLLGREKAKDYLDQNGLDWSDMKGYNDMSLLSRASSGISGLASHGSSYLQNIGNDLGKLYSGQPSNLPLNSVGKHVIRK